MIIGYVVDLWSNITNHAYNKLLLRELFAIQIRSIKGLHKRLSHRSLWSNLPEKIMLKLYFKCSVSFSHLSIWCNIVFIKSEYRVFCALICFLSWIKPVTTEFRWVNGLSLSHYLISFFFFFFFWRDVKVISFFLFNFFLLSCQGSRVCILRPAEADYECLQVR